MQRVELSWASQSFSFHLQIKRSRSWFQFYGRRFPWVSNVTCLKLGDQTFNLNRSTALSRGRCISTFFHFHRWHLHRPSFTTFASISFIPAVLPLSTRAPSLFYRSRVIPIDDFFSPGPSRPVLPLSHSIESLVRFLTDSATTPARKRASP